MSSSTKVLQRLISEVLQEDYQGFQQQVNDMPPWKHSLYDPTFDSEYRPGGDRKFHKSQAKKIKRIFAAEADHAFFAGLNKVHWINNSTYPSRRILRMMSSKGNDEVSTAAYRPGEPMVSGWGNVGVLLQGRTTLAANDMNSLVTGYAEDAAIYSKDKYQNSGLPRRPTRAGQRYFKDYILDADSFFGSGSSPDRSNEIVLDNWKILGIIIQHSHKIAASEISKIRSTGLPIFDTKMNPFDWDKL